MAGQRSQSTYRVIRRIATGGMAEVFQAESDGLAEFHKTVALKRVLPHLSTNTKFVRMFLDEARLAARLSHRNIVQVFDVGRVDDTYFLVMEYVDGVTLRDALEFLARRGEHVPTNVAVHVATEMCNGLNYAHALADRDGTPLGIVHRDISPANVLLSRFGGVRIVDFGLAKAASQAEKTEPGVIKGKYGYLAPETASGLEADAKADQFATGVVLWEMIAGRRLFMGATNAETVQQVREADVPHLRSIRPEIPDALDALLARALAKRRDDRFPSMAAMSRALTEVQFESRLTVSAEDVMNLVDRVFGEGKETEAKPPSPMGSSAPGAGEQFRIHSVVAKDIRSPISAITPAPATEGATALAPEPVSPIPEPASAEATAGGEVKKEISSERKIEKRRAKPDESIEAPVPTASNEEPQQMSGVAPAETKPSHAVATVSTAAPTTNATVRGGARWPFVVLPVLAIAGGSGYALRETGAWPAVMARAHALIRQHLSGHGPQTARASMDGPVDRSPTSVSTTGAGAISTDAGVTAPDASTLAEQSAVVPGTLPDGGMLDEPRYRDIVRAEVAIRARLDPCVTQFGHEFRHARLAVQYDGATGAVVQANFTDRYFNDRPIGACILAAVRAERMPVFRRPLWDTTYAFMIR